MPRWLKVLLALLGGVALALGGVAFFLDERRELAFRRYQQRKRELKRLRRQLEAQDMLDQQKLEEIERQMQEAQREFLRKCAGTRDEARRIEEMSAEEVANESTRLEQILRRRLERAGVS